jgi:hypothetical protein
MTNDIKSFYWNANAENCIGILNYEFQGVTEVVNDSYGNDESPSCFFDIDGVHYKLFFPSDYKGDYAQFLLIDQTLYDKSLEMIVVGEFLTINDVLNYFKNLNVI